MSLTNPTPQETLSLIQSIETSFPSDTVGQGKWYILVVSTLTAGGHPELAAELYKYLISKPEFSTSEQRQALVRRLREALFKIVSVVGVPKALEAVFSIAEVERPEDRDYTFTRKDWKSGPDNIARGSHWLSQIYRQDLAAPESVLNAHQDFNWLSQEITYGLYLSDHSILDAIETEIVVLSGIMLQNLKRETGWHLRGIRRVGVSHENVEVIQQQMEKVAQFCGLTLNRVPRVADIEHEVPWEK